MNKMTSEAESEKYIKIVLCEPGKKARIKTIPNCLESLQKTVGGYIEAIYPFDDPVAIVCNEEGKLNGMEANRALCDSSGQIYDIIVGPFFITGLGDEDFASLSKELQDKYYSMFEYPEMFFWDGKRVQVFPIETPE